MIYDKTSLVRQLVPTKYHFDAYNRVNCLNARDKPFFSDNVIDFDEMHHVTISLVKHDKIRLTFSSVCSHGKIFFPSYYMTLEDFVLKLQEAVKTGRDFIPLEISVNWTSYIHCNSCEDITISCQELQKSHPKKVFAAVSFDFEQMKEALALYFEITNITNVSLKGGQTMKTNNKFFGLNFEFGVSKDKNVASTLMGLAVKNAQNGNWYVFDPVNNTRKNLANMKFGNFPGFIEKISCGLEADNISSADFNFICTTPFLIFVKLQFYNLIA